MGAYEIDLTESGESVSEWAISYRENPDEGLDPDGWVVVVTATHEEIIDTIFTFLDDATGKTYPAAPIDPALIEAVEQIEERAMNERHEEQIYPTPWQDAGVRQSDFL